MPKKKQDHRTHRLSIRVTLLLILTGLFAWSYYQFTQSYKSIETSNKMIEALLMKKTGLARRYFSELGLTKDNLVQTEAFLQKVQEENEKLHEKIKLLDKMAELEKTITRLKEKNALIINQMTSPSREKTPVEKKFNTIQEGENLIKDLKKELAKIKKKIKKLQKEERRQRIAAQREIDQMKLLLGNNGYITRDGKLSPPRMPRPNENQNIKIDVEFVK